MEHGRRNVHRAQGAYPADAQHDLLAQPPVGLRDIQAVRDGAKVRRVRLEIRVEQEKRHATYLRAPHRDPDITVSDRRFHLDGLDPSHRQLATAALRVHLDLATARVDVLPAKTLLVEETYGN